MLGVASPEDSESDFDGACSISSRRTVAVSEVILGSRAGDTDLFDFLESLGGLALDLLDFIIRNNTDRRHVSD